MNTGGSGTGVRDLLPTAPHTVALGSGGRRLRSRDIGPPMALRLLTGNTIDLEAGRMKAALSVPEVCNVHAICQRPLYLLKEWAQTVWETAMSGPELNTGEGRN
mmetsp:Transcript_34572/g.63097  ORF Transcript_34572/g.63097 Transcript_34572/m.63097 type:complete len:104 (+) Transcript_34572:359-670(+)